MDLASELVLRVLADGQDHILGELLVNLFLEVVDGDEWALEMFDIREHVKGISQ